MKAFLFISALLMGVSGVFAQDNDVQARFDENHAVSVDSAKVRHKRNGKQEPRKLGGKFKSYEYTKPVQMPNPDYQVSLPESEFNSRNINGTVTVRVQWPVSLEYASDIKPLQEYLINDVLKSNNTNDIEEAIQDYVDSYFVQPNLVDNDFQHLLYISPRGYNRNFASFVIERYINPGAGNLLVGSFSQSSVIIYDKLTGEVMSGSMVLADSESRELLNVVNEHIKKRSDDYSEAESVPSMIIPGKNRLTFVFPRYSIAPGSEGEIRIPVPYDQLSNFLTPEFRNLLEE